LLGIDIQMTSLTAKITELKQDVMSAKPKEKKFVMLLEEDLEEDELKNLEKLFYVYKVDIQYDYKLQIDQLLKETQFLLVDISKKEGLCYYHEIKDYLKSESEYDVKIYYKAKTGKKVDVCETKQRFGVDVVIKYLPKLFLNAEDFIKRCVDHIGASSGFCGLSCLKKN
jgi:hypothetical protein